MSKRYKYTNREFSRILAWNFDNGIKIHLQPCNNQKYVKIVLEIKGVKTTGSKEYLQGSKKLNDKMDEIYIHFYEKNINNENT